MGGPVTTRTSASSPSGTAAPGWRYCSSRSSAPGATPIGNACCVADVAPPDAIGVLALPPPIPPLMPAPVAEEDHVSVPALRREAPLPALAPPKSDTLPVDWTGTRMRRSACGSERQSAAYLMLIEKRARPAIAVEIGIPQTA